MGSVGQAQQEWAGTLYNEGTSRLQSPIAALVPFNSSTVPSLLPRKDQGRSSSCAPDCPASALNQSATVLSSQRLSPKQGLKTHPGSPGESVM